MHHPHTAYAPATLPYRHVIWDWNGTLMDDAWLCVQIMNAMLERRSMRTVDLDTYRRHFGFPVKAYYDWLGFDPSADTFEAISHEYIDAYEARRLECSLHRDATALLDRFQTLGVSQVIVSAYRQNTLEEIVSHYRLEGYFEKLIGLDNIFAAGKVENAKAHRSTLPHADGELLLIGDTLHDFEVAQAIGADCILLCHGHHNRERLETTGATVCDSIADIAARLFPVNAGAT